MTWSTLYLRAADEAALLSALDAAGLMSEEGPRIASHTHALDIIGSIPGKAGYHANLGVTGEPHAALAGISIARPAAPVRVWA